MTRQDLSLSAVSGNDVASLRHAAVAAFIAEARQLPERVAQHEREADIGVRLLAD
ncbi:hypothetical protein AB4Z48_35515 [Cupriavidus sp. 2TAF22]|uniref:hypothetical protein n=1 Tax=unclassified Cupriavidus TaxID=2640874 RepID=UPI003F927E5C